MKRLHGRGTTSKPIPKKKDRRLSRSSPTNGITGSLAPSHAREGQVRFEAWEAANKKNVTIGFDVQMRWMHVFISNFTIGTAL